MNNTEKYFIAVLCRGLGICNSEYFDNDGNYRGEINEDIKNGAKKLSERHSLVGLYSEGVLRLSRDNAEKMMLTMSVAALVAKSAERFNAMNKTIEELASQGVDVTVMKGYVLRNYYSMPEYRSFGDIDLLIKKKDSEKAKKILEKLGFSESNNELHVIGMRKDQQYFELHTDILGDDFFVPGGAAHLLREPWDSAVETSRKGIFEFSAEFHFLYLILHIAKHFYCMGAGVRMFLDVALMAEKGIVDWKKTAEYIKASGMAEFTLSVFSVCNKFFGTTIPEELRSALCGDNGAAFPDEAASDEMADYVIRGGIFGFDGPAYEVAKLRQAYLENRKDDREDDGKTVKKAASRAIIPDRATMERRYPFCRKKPWLLPAAHVARIFSVLTNRRRARSAAMRMKRLCASDDSAKKQVEFYKKIGL
ncbi:MAG: nucleotidyltransferase family protein [Clostridia bacterium]|nr:nucleotidyltransferase family protein [Clostridia bacterium]